MALRVRCCARILSLIAHLRLVYDGEQPATVLLQQLRQQTHRLLPYLLRQGLAASPVESSIDSPATPVATASLTLSATAAGSTPNPFSKSAFTGRSVAATISRKCRALRDCRHVQSTRRNRNWW